MKIGLLAGRSLSEFKLNALELILRDSSFSIELAIIDIRPEKSIKQKLIKNIKKGRGGYILVMAFKALFSGKDKVVNTKEYCFNSGIAIIESDNPYEPAIIEKIKTYKLDILLLISGYGIIKKPLLNITPKGVLSYHHGNMRKYRGAPPALWELYNNEREMGVTVQILAPGLDCGVPVEEKTLQILKSDSLRALKKKAFQESEIMMYNALKKLSDPAFVPTKINSLGKIYTLPNLSQWIRLNIKIWTRKISCYFDL